MVVEFGPRIGQPMPPDVMVGEGGSREGRLAIAGSDGQGRVHMPSVLKGEGSGGDRRLTLPYQLGHPVERPQRHDILLTSSDEPGITRDDGGPGILLDPLRDLLRRLVDGR